jgi:retron-type reverse transcriptase
MRTKNTRLANGTQKPTDWNTIHWRKANRMVRNLRRRIFRATQESDQKKGRSLPKLMLKSYSNRLVSVRRVTQINAGKNTPGVDKLVIKTPEARGRLVDALAHHTLWKAKPARRVSIAKANHKVRPLGIPVVVDRCLQALVKNALEPAWEARFEGTSYGFRPGRSCHDAIEQILVLARPNKTKKWVLDAAIKGAFDNICRGELVGKRALVRYADDVVCFCAPREDAEQGHRLLTEWLNERGLTLSEEKTRIVHLTEGFACLGCNIRPYPAAQTARTGWKLLIKPSKEAVKHLRKKLKDQWEKAQGADVPSALATLNPLIRGWANSFRSAVAKEIFNKLDDWMFYKANR